MSKSYLFTTFQTSIFKFLLLLSNRIVSPFTYFRYVVSHRLLRCSIYHLWFFLCITHIHDVFDILVVFEVKQINFIYIAQNQNQWTTSSVLSPSNRDRKNSACWKKMEESSGGSLSQGRPTCNRYHIYRTERQDTDYKLHWQNIWCKLNINICKVCGSRRRLSRRRVNHTEISWLWSRAGSTRSDLSSLTQTDSGFKSLTTSCPWRHVCKLICNTGWKQKIMRRKLKESFLVEQPATQIGLLFHYHCFSDTRSACKTSCRREFICILSHCSQASW